MLYIERLQLRHNNDVILLPHGKSIAGDLKCADMEQPAAFSDYFYKLDAKLKSTLLGENSVHKKGRSICIEERCFLS